MRHPKQPQELETVLACFRLEGEDVYRLWDDKPCAVRPRPGKVSAVEDESGRRHLLHRVKFALAHGWLPDEVDHEDRDPANCGVSNLRPATRQQNNWNRANYRKARVLPIGVSPNGKRFKAQANINRKSVHLGTYDTPEEASHAYQRHCRDRRGQFHPVEEPPDDNPHSGT